MSELVAPRTGAWIETQALEETYNIKPSPLVQGRGLKHSELDGKVARTTSPLVQGRGLKHHESATPHAERGVAPRTGAWIETLPGLGMRMPGRVAPRTGAWIETRRRRQR